MKFPPTWPFAMALLAAGCSSQTTLWSQYYSVLREGIRTSFGDRSIAREQAAAVPYASLAYRLDSDNEMMLVLATDENGEQLWTAASRIVLMTRDGRLLRSVGLRHDRGGTASLTNLAPPPVADALKAPFRSVRLVDFPDIGRYSVRLDCTATARRRELVGILGTAMALTRVDESCVSQSPRWSFTDNYWLDPESGFVWQSLQHLHPAGSRLRIKILRPPG